MQTHVPQLWWLRLATFSLAALASASAAYWVLQWKTPAPASVGAPPVLAPARMLDPQAVARLLGGGQSAAAAPAAPSLASRLKLLGVVANQAHGGSALIAVDGKPARPFRVGAVVTDSLVLHSVGPRSAALATDRQAPVALTLELPKLGQP